MGYYPETPPGGMVDVYEPEYMAMAAIYGTELATISSGRCKSEGAKLVSEM
jgi:hypothetical protein